MIKQRFLVKSYGDNIDGTRAGMVKLLELTDDHKSCVIVVPTLGHVKSSMLAKLLPEDIAKQLFKNRKVNFENGSTIELCSISTLKNFKYADAYLALWGSESTIREIETNTYSANSVVLVTWTPKDSEEWEKQFPVQVIYDDKKMANQSIEAIVTMPVESGKVGWHSASSQTLE